MSIETTSSSMENNDIAAEDSDRSIDRIWMNSTYICGCILSITNNSVHLK